jgi:hypothetical protein
MRSAWEIIVYNGASQEYSATISGSLSRAEIITIIQRLVCRHLSYDEIISASLETITHLQPQQSGRSISVGLTVHAVATPKE